MNNQAVNQSNETEPGLFIKYLPYSIRKVLTGRPNLQKMVGSTWWLLFDKIVRLALGVTVGAWVARYLGPQMFGKLAYSIALIAMFQGIANLGADGIVVRDIVKNTGREHEILGTVFWLRVFSGLLSWVIVVASAAILQPNDTTGVIITAIIGGVLVFQSVDTIDLWFQSQHQNKRTVIPKLISYVFTNGIKIVLILNKASIIWFATALLLDVVVSAVGLIISYRKYPLLKKWRFQTSRVWILVRESFPFLLSGLAIMIYMRIDQIMIREMVSDKELGIYSAGIALSSFWGVIPLTLLTTLAPYVARKKTESEKAYYEALDLVFKVYGAIAIAVVTLVLITGPVAVDILYGKSYAGANEILAIHIFTFIFISLGIAQNLWIVNERAGRIGLYKTMIGLIVCLAGNLLMIPKYGSTGAALVAVMVQFSSAVGSNIIFSRRILRLQLLGLFQFPFAIIAILNRRSLY